MKWKEIVDNRWMLVTIDEAGKFYIWKYYHTREEADIAAQVLSETFDRLMINCKVYTLLK